MSRYGSRVQWPSRHPLAATLAVAIAGAAVAVLVAVLVIMPAVVSAGHAVDNVPGGLVSWYQGYWDRVSQVFGQGSGPGGR